MSSSPSLLAVAPPSPLQQFRRFGLRVTDLSDQLWCEQRLALSLARGKEETPEMKQGKERHQALDEEITEIVRVRPETRADIRASALFNAWAALVQLQQQGICREIPVFGYLGELWVVGVIDQVRIRMRITGWSCRTPKPAKSRLFQRLPKSAPHNYR